MLGKPPHFRKPLTRLQLSLSNPLSQTWNGGRMYEAPDRYKRLISARLPGGESAGLAATGDDGQSSPFRDVQLISRAQLAPFFAAVNIMAALMLISNLWEDVSPTWLVTWLRA